MTFSRDKIRRIRRLLRDGYRVDSLAEKYGTSPDVIREVARPKRKGVDPALRAEARKMVRAGSPEHVVIANFGDVL